MVGIRKINLPSFFNKKDPSNPTLVAMDRFEMKIDPDTEIPFALFPIK